MKTSAYPEIRALVKTSLVFLVENRSLRVLLVVAHDRDRGRVEEVITDFRHSVQLRIIRDAVDAFNFHVMCLLWIVIFIYIFVIYHRY